MKYINFLFLLIILLFLSGCSNPSNGTPSPTNGLDPSIGATPSISISPTIAPTESPSPTTVPAPTEAITEGVPQTPDNNSAQQLLSNMTLEEKVGQMFLVRCDKATALDDLKQYHFGGFLLFSEDFNNQTKASMQEIISGYQSASQIPLLIGVDEEGGTVNRISKYPAFRKVPFRSPQDLFQSGGLSLIETDTKEKAELLKSLGVNLNLAPVCDVSMNPKDFIYKRSFGQNAERTSEYVAAVVAAMKNKNIGCTLKHFPGYGNNIDTHTGIAIDKRSREEFYTTDFLPFEAGINAGAESILVSHNIVMAFDKAYPASLSSNIHTILRNDLKFHGVIITDDLSMDAIKNYTNNGAAAVLAVQAGNDLLIASDYKVQIPAVISAVENGEIPIDIINESVLRILGWKLSLGLIQ